MTESVVSGAIHLDRISRKGTRDTLRQAVDMARRGGVDREPVGAADRDG